jgi:hypothetical protein
MHRRQPEWTKCLWTGLAAGAAMLLPAEMAGAQEFNEVQAVIKPQLNLERARHLRRLIRQRGEDLLRQQLTGDDGSVALDPLAYGEDGIEELEEEPAAEAVGLNLWFDGASTWLEDSHPDRGYEGTQHVLSLGGDRQVTERLVLGAIGVHAGSDVDDIFLPGGSSTRGWGLGPYAAVFLTDTIVLTASAVRTWTDNSLASGGVTAGYDSRDWTLNANVTSYHFAADWQFAPTAGISYTVEQEDGYVDSSASAYAASTTRTGSVVFRRTALVFTCVGERHDRRAEPGRRGGVDLRAGDHGDELGAAGRVRFRRERDCGHRLAGERCDLALPDWLDRRAVQARLPVGERQRSA